MKHLRFTTSDCKEIGIRKFEFVAKTQMLLFTNVQKDKDKKKFPFPIVKLFDFKVVKQPFIFKISFFYRIDLNVRQNVFKLQTKFL